jgi:3-oxoacyl-[acyl-carrier protein] reductase
MRLQDRVAIVTGGSRGIGRAYAERFLREGASVMVADVDDERAGETVDELGAVGAIRSVHCDVSDAGSVEQCARETVERFGRIDVLINNAALYGDWNMADQSFEYLKTVFDVNLHGVWLMTRAVAPQMVAQEYGRIVNQSSGAAYNYGGGLPTPEFQGLNAFNYQQTKWGVVGLTKFSAGQLGRWNITVNCIAPGVTMTEATKKIVPDMYIQGMTAMTAMKSTLEPEDLAGACVFFASDDAKFVTGQTLVVDGGLAMPA